VEGVLSLLDFLQEVNVYGVSVPGVEGLLDFKTFNSFVGGGVLFQFYR
jgi:hypothetical protein